MSTNPDILDYIHVALNGGGALTPAHVEQILDQARRIFGGETVYVRATGQHRVTRRTIQNRRARAR